MKYTVHTIIDTRLLLKKKTDIFKFKEKNQERRKTLSQSIKKTQVTDNLATLAQEDKSSRVALQNNQISKPLSSNKTVQNEFLYK